MNLARTLAAATGGLLLVTLSGPVAAQDVLGSITGTLDGDDREWFITASENGSQSDWSGSETWASVSLVGHAQPDTMSSHQALMIGFTLTGSPGAANVSGPEVTYLAEGLSKGYVGDPDETDVTVTVTDHAFENGVLKLSGTVSGTLAYSEDYGRTLDMNDTVTIDAAFDTAVRPLE